MPLGDDERVRPCDTYRRQPDIAGSCSDAVLPAWMRGVSLNYLGAASSGSGIAPMRFFKRSSGAERGPIPPPRAHNCSRRRRARWSAGALVGVSTALVSSTAMADCAFHAQSRDNIVILDRRTVLLSGSLRPDIVVKTFAPLSRRASVVVIRDSFCSFAKDVLLVDDRLIGVGRVTVLR